MYYLYESERHTNSVFCILHPTETTDAEVRDMFLPFGKVELVSVPRNRDTGKSRGFAFVDMGSEEEREAAIADVDGTMVGGRTIRVNKSLPKDEVSKKSKKREIGEFM